MSAYYDDGRVTLHHGDCLDVLRALPDCSVDAVVTDPPAGIAFMGAAWDRDKGGRDAWVAWLAEVMREVMRVLKPGAHGLVWALPRTSHWTATALEDAGFEVRDKIVHHFGSGFPKSLDVSKALDRKAGAVREVVGTQKLTGNAALTTKEKGGTYGVQVGTAPAKTVDITAPATDAAKQWAGWGTALKPASEDWWLVRKPLVGTVADNVLTYGTGAINVDACRVASNESTRRTNRAEMGYHGGNLSESYATGSDAGRWPANVVLSHSADCGDDCADDCAVRVLGEQSGERPSGARVAGVRKGVGYQGIKQGDGGPAIEANTGTAARFFNVFHYAAKPSTRERNAGHGKNTHPTVKSQGLMRHLVRLITPPGGVALDPFAGSGSTLVAAVAEGFRGIGIEREAEYVEIAAARVKAAEPPASKLFEEAAE